MELSRQDRIDPSLSIMVGPGDPDLGRAPDHIRSVPHFFELMASDAPWLRFEGHVYTVADIWTQAAEWASSIRLHGIGPGDCVALLMCNRPEFIISWLAVNMTGATAAFVPVAAAESGLERYFASIRPQLAIFEAELGAELLADGAGLRQLAPDVFMRALNGRSASDPIADEAPSPSDVSCLVFTSGSSGPPKAVAFSHRYVLELGYHIAHGKGMQPAEKLYFCNPLFHGDGLIATITTVSLKGEMHLARRFSVRQFWSDVASYGSTMFYYVGASLSFLARNPFPETPPRHSLRFATGGGATEAGATLFEERFGIPVLDAYSQTECLCCCSNTLGARRKGTVGRPYPGMEVRIVDDLDQPVPRGTVGNIVVRPPRPFMTFSGYLNNAEATLVKQRNLFHHMGDKGVMDEDGYVRFAGRAAQGLRRRGENLQPDDIEELVEKLPWVNKAAAIGVASEHGDQDILILIVVEGQAPDQATLVADCLAALPRIMRPRWIEVVASLPMTPTHRLARKELPEAPGAGAFLVEQPDASAPA